MNYTHLERMAAIKQYGKDFMTSPECQNKIKQVLQKYEQNLKNLIHVEKTCQENVLSTNNAFKSLNDKFLFVTKKGCIGLAMKLPEKGKMLYYFPEEGFTKREVSSSYSMELKLDQVKDLELFERDFPIAENNFYLYLDEFLTDYAKKREEKDWNEYLLSILYEYKQDTSPDDILFLDLKDELLSLHCLKTDGESILLKENIAKASDIDFDAIYLELEQYKVKTTFIFPPSQITRY